MTTVSPVPEAIDRLRVYGERELLGFIEEVTSKNDRDLLRILPSVDGFRKDSAKSLPKRRRAMLTHFLKKGGTAAKKAQADDAYFYLWRAWAEQRLPNVEGLTHRLSGIEKVARKDDSTVTLDEAVEGLFSYLHEQSFLNHCSSETITRLLCFSPFAVTERLERLAASAKPEIAVEKDRALSTLPGRLNDDEELLEKLQVRVGELAEEVAGLSAASTQAPVMTNSLTDSKAHFDALEERIAELLQHLRQVMQEQEKARQNEAAVAVRIAAIERSSADLEGLWTDLDNRSTSIASEFRQNLAALADAAATGNTNPPVAQQQDPSALGLPALHVVLLGEVPAEVKTLHTGVDAAALLAANLIATGLKPSMAGFLAEELLAAVVTGRILFLKGSLAPEMARAVALSLAAEHGVRARVPVGFVDASKFDEDTIKLLPAQRNSVAVVVLERVNNAPLEVLVDTLAELARVANVFIVATMSDGLSALPDQPLYLQLGPILDTDVLDWTLFPKAGAPMAAGALVTLDRKALAMAQFSGAPDTEELVRLLRKAPSFRNPRIEWAAVAYLRTLQGFRKSDAPTSLQSVGYTWLWPLWRMLGLPVEELEQELDGGKLDGKHADSRLKLLLELVAGGRG